MDRWQPNDHFSTSYTGQPRRGFRQEGKRKYEPPGGHTSSHVQSLYGFSGKGELLREDQNVRTKNLGGESRGIRGLLLQERPPRFCGTSWRGLAGKSRWVSYELNKRGGSVLRAYGSCAGQREGSDGAEPHAEARSVRPAAVPSPAPPTPSQSARMVQNHRSAIKTAR